MRLETWDELEEEEQVFCSKCGKQLCTVDEIAKQLCQGCHASKNQSSEGDGFFCWACGKKLGEMGEVAQGLCHGCKASIIRKIQFPTKKSFF